MHYKINGGIVESELAAKSIYQPNKQVLKYISSLNPECRVLDYGCGKLRYTIPLSKSVKNVIAIDSFEQLNRIQIINGVKTSLIKCSIDNVLILPIDSYKWRALKYDVVLCTNVLSAIPLDNIRLELLTNIKNVLELKGEVFISTQYRNSYFKTYEQRTDVERYNDGWLIPRANKKFSFYSPLNVKDIICLCNRVGLHVFNSYQKDGSCYVIAKLI